MSGRDDLAAAREAIMARKREELGEPPTPEELLAWRDGRLDTAARELLEARIAVYPDAARALADLAAFPDVDPGPGTPALSDEEIDAGWAAFRQRLEKLPRPVPVAVTADRPVFGRLIPWQTVAAAILFMALGQLIGYALGRASRTVPESPVSPARNVTIAELEPLAEGGFRSSVAPVELPATSEAVVLILALPGTEEFSGYEAEILDQNGTRRWSGDGLVPSSLGTIQVSFPRAAFAPGVYGVDLFGVDRAGRTKKVARYELRVALTPEVNSN